MSLAPPVAVPRGRINLMPLYVVPFRLPPPRIELANRGVAHPDFHFNVSFLSQYEEGADSEV